MRGEKLAHSSACFMPEGSPPHARGKEMGDAL